MRNRFFGGLSVGLLVSVAGTVNAEGDAAAGRLAAETCMGCHAIQSYFNVYPTYHVPKVAGQQAGYIASALKAYRDGSRKHGTMHANAINLSDEAIANIAAYMAGQGQ